MKSNLIYKIKHCINNKSSKKSDIYLSEKINKTYFTHKIDNLFFAIRDRLLNFDLNLRELSINETLNSYHKINKEILKDVLIDNSIALESLFTKKNINSYTKYIKHYHSLESLSKRGCKEFYQKLSYSIIQHVCFHNNSFKNEDLYNKKYYSNSSDNLRLYQLYSLATNNIAFVDGCISYNLEELYVNTYNLIDSHLYLNLTKTIKHKRNIAIDCYNQLIKIQKIEKEGIPFKTYYPFYKESKITFKKIIKNQNCVFYLKTNEVNKLATILTKLFSKDLRKNRSLKNNYKDDIKKFLSNDYEYSVLGTFTKHKKYFVYVIYLLYQHNKCDLDLLKKYLYKQTGIQVKLLNKYFKEFNSGTKPKRHQLIDIYLKNR